MVLDDVPEDVLEDANFPPAPSAFSLGSELTWLPAGFLAALLLLTLTASSFGSESQLQWQKASPNPSRTNAARTFAGKGRVKTLQFVDPRVQTLNAGNRFEQPAHQPTVSQQPVADFAPLQASPTPTQPIQIQPSLVVDPQIQTGVQLQNSVLNRRSSSIRLVQGTQDDTNALLEEFSTPMGERVPVSPPSGRREFDPPEFEPLPPQPTRERIAPREPSVVPDIPEFDPFEDPTDNASSEDQTQPQQSGSDTREPEEPGSGAKGSGTRSQQEDSEDKKRRTKEREEATKTCAEELSKLRSNNLSLLDISISRTGVEGEDYPYICSIDDGLPLSARHWSPITYTWKASALCHKPLYFEQQQLERYGHSWGPVLQPVISGAHFFGHLAVLPYSMGLKTPNECVYALGHYRPGNCAPYMIPAIPFTWRAAIFQGGFATGAAFAIP